MEWPAQKITKRKVSSLKPYDRNARTHSDEQVDQIAASIQEWGFTTPILIDEDGGIIAGHGRLLAAKKLGLKMVPTITARGWTDAQKRAYIIADNKLALNAGWDEGLLKVELEQIEGLDFDMSLIGFDADELAGILSDDEEGGRLSAVSGALAERFGIPPFSVLDARTGEWQERKRTWKAVIGDKGESREKTLFKGGDALVMNRIAEIGTVSILDPVLAETMCNWFCAPGATAFDPFAGDTVFGFVAGTLGINFIGIELRKEQCEINSQRCKNLPCTYHNDTSENMDNYVEDGSVDFVFSCPPYADLEVYSDDPNDLSNMPHDEFFAAYKRILQKTYAKLKNDRFAVIVMGEVRSKKDGAYIGTVPQTIQIMTEAGYAFYNEIILVTPPGTLPLRSGRAMQRTRKVGKTHQNVLVFLKGDAKEAVKFLGDVYVTEHENEQV